MNPTQSHPNSRKVTIFRKDAFIMEAQKGAGAEFVAQARKSIGSYFETSVSHTIGSGLTTAEKNILMPELVDSDPSERQFRQKCADYFASIKTTVPYDKGVTLEIGLEVDNSKPVSEKNFPIKVAEYIKYRHALNHPQVAISKKAGEGNPLIEYYIFDAAAVETDTLDNNEAKDKALEKYLIVKKEGIAKVDQLLTLLKIDPRRFNGPNADKLKLQELEKQAREFPQEFVAQFENKYFDQLYILKSLVNTGIIKQIGAKFVDAEDVMVTIGNNEEEAIVWLKDPANSEALVLYKMKMQEGLKTALPATQKLTGAR